MTSEHLPDFVFSSLLFDSLRYQKRIINSTVILFLQQRQILRIVSSHPVTSRPHNFLWKKEKEIVYDDKEKKTSVACTIYAPPFRKYKVVFFPGDFS